MARFDVEIQSAHALRDKRGRFRPRDGSYGLPRNVPRKVADMLDDLGVTPEMYRTAAVALVLPDDLEDIPALELSLREWVLANMDHWVNGKNRRVRRVQGAPVHLRDRYLPLHAAAKTAQAAQGADWR